MQLSPLYLEQLEASHQVGFAQGEQLGEQRGELNVVLKLLARQVGQLPKDLEAQVSTLSLVELDLLVDDLLNFGQVGDLLQWLQGNRS